MRFSSGDCDMNWKRRLIVFFGLVMLIGCNDPVTPTPNESPDPAKDGDPPQTDLTGNHAGTSSFPGQAIDIL